MCGGVAHSFCTAVKQLSESKKHCQICLMSSTQLLYGLCSQSVAHSLTCGNVPPLHTSGYVIARDQCYHASPGISTASDKRWGEKAWVRGYRCACAVCINYRSGWGLRLILQTLRTSSSNFGILFLTSGIINLSNVASKCISDWTIVRIFGLHSLSSC